MDLCVKNVKFRSQTNGRKPDAIVKKLRQSTRYQLSVMDLIELSSEISTVGIQGRDVNALFNEIPDLRMLWRLWAIPSTWPTVKLS